MAKPIAYSEELANEIAARVAEGESLKTLGAMDDMPSLRTLIRWTAEHPEFETQLFHARQAKADGYIEEAVEISDEPVKTLADAARNRVRAQTRLHVAEKLAPRRYGARVGLHGVAGEPPLMTRPLSEYEVARRVLFAMRKAAEIVAARQLPTPMNTEPNSRR